MAQSNTKKIEPTVSPFTTAVVTAMRQLYPEKLADSSFDNTGLLLEAPYRPGHLRNLALLTIDLTKAVADEAIKLKSSVIISYHPIIFRPLKSITQANTQQNTLLRLAQEGISVYSPHTAVDAAPGGIDDWLCDIVTGTGTNSSSTHPHTRTIINDCTPLPGFEGAGYGRIVRFHSPLPLSTIINLITTSLKLPHISVAVPQFLSHTPEKYSHPIQSIGICAGSGGSHLNNLNVDLLFTGELSHHEALAAVEQGKCVITTFHSNTERGYLSERMEEKLINKTKSVMMEKIGRREWELDTDFQVKTSAADEDPYKIVSVREKSWDGEKKA